MANRARGQRHPLYRPRPPLDRGRPKAPRGHGLRRRLGRLRRSAPGAVRGSDRGGIVVTRDFLPLAFPNESSEYRHARNELLSAEMALRRELERAAELRRAPPPGGHTAAA